MTDNNDGSTGGLVKKLLFPASASGANDTFKNPDNLRAISDPRMSPSPRRSPTSDKSPSHLRHQNSSSQGNPIDSMAKEQFTTKSKQSAVVPPRFFSSTHPSIEKTNSQQESTVRSVLSPQQQPLQTPSRVPPSPPRLNRQPVTPSSEMTTTAQHAESHQSNNRKLFAKSSPQSVDVAAHGEPLQQKSLDEDELVQYYSNEAGSAISPSRKQRPRHERIRAENKTGRRPPFPKTSCEDEDENLRFLQEFKLKRQQDHSFTSTEEEAKTEVHANTTAQLRKKHEGGVEALSLSQKLESVNGEANDEQPGNLPTETRLPSLKEAGDEVAMEQGEDHSSSVDDQDKQENEQESPHNIHSYPSYYDDPYHNPLVASAMKPNHLFPKNNDTSMESDVNSNVSEMGTIVGAPLSLMAERFAELDAMEREGNLAMNLDDAMNAEDDDALFDESLDPALKNYRAFRINDNENDDEIDGDRGHLDNSFDPFKTPAPPTNAVAARTQGPYGVQEDAVDSSKGQSTPSPRAMTSEESHEAMFSAPQTGRSEIQQFGMDCKVKREEMMPDESALSVVDSEIDELVRRSAQESLGGGIVRSYSSNNSAEVFRTPSTGSAGEKKISNHGNRHHSRHAVTLLPGSGRPPVQRNTESNNSLDKEDEEDDDEELLGIDTSRSAESPSVSSRERRKKRPNSSLQRALTRAQQGQEEAEDLGNRDRMDQERILKKEDEKEEKEDDLNKQQPPHREQQYRFEVRKDDRYDEFNHMITTVDSSHHASAGTPGSAIANTIRRLGSKLAQHSPARKPMESKFFFDIDDEDEEDEGDNTEWLSQRYISSSAPTTPNQRKSDRHKVRGDMHQSLSKIREAFPSSPGRNSTASSSIGGAAPTSFLLRSPGSTARLMADFRRESSSSSGSAGNHGKEEPKHFSGWNQRVPSILKSYSSTSIGNGVTPKATGGRSRQDQPLTKLNAFRIPRSCLSFDTTLDNEYEYNPERDDKFFFDAPNNNSSIQRAQSYDVRNSWQSSPCRASIQLRQNRDGNRMASSKNKTQALYGSSRSFDISSGVLERPRPPTPQEIQPTLNLDATAFRVAPYVRQRNGYHPHSHGFTSRKGHKLVSGERKERLRLMDDTSVSPTKRSSKELLHTPQRIEIEREDALNLLACLCERGVALHGNETVPTDRESDIDANKSIGKQTGSQPCELPLDNPDDIDNTKALQHDEDESCTYSMDPETVASTVSAIREICKQVDNGEITPVSSKPSTQKVRVEVLDELLRSHVYAHEMKRAALSASAWLRSIGHTENRSLTTQAACKHGIANESDAAATETEQAAGERETKTASGNGSNASSVEVLTLKAMLHQAQIEAHEKDEVAKQLDQELSKCRAEIGRLKSASFSKAPFASPNRSILDDDEESTMSVAENSNKVNVKICKGHSKDSKVADESIVDPNSSLFANDEKAEVVRESDTPVARELALFKSALTDANAIIKKLHSELQKSNPSDSGIEAPTIEVSQKAFSAALLDESTSNVDNASTSFSDQQAENRVVNVRMLDGENFVTDWDRLESLPPPPDHGLRSPIVSALLKQWSSDEGLQGSLLSWMEEALSTEDLSSVPPLTLSSLDHQLRDGFTMHVLPLLLRRSDILVDVKTRAHRKTTYDLSVSVASIPRSGLRHCHIESKPDSASVIESVAHSATTAHISNGYVGAVDHYEVGSTAASYTTQASAYSTLLHNRASDDRNEGAQQQPGIMSALGGALGGLLSRRKPSSNYYDAGIPSNLSYDMGSAVGAAGPGPMDLPPPEFATPQKPGQTDEPYHRLVSAPPGRIGVSFVEYRGHAIVSDVSDDSPLHGWIFPSDILIAIDEVPVSGMRLKEIVKVLQGRSERQRAMRVISSHGLTEFAMNSATP